MLYVIAYPIVAKNNSHTFHFFSSKQGSRLHSRGVVCWGHTLGQSLVQGGGAQQVWMQQGESPQGYGTRLDLGRVRRQH